MPEFKRGELSGGEWLGEETLRFSTELNLSLRRLKNRYELIVLLEKKEKRWNIKTRKGRGQDGEVKRKEGSTIPKVGDHLCHLL